MRIIAISRGSEIAWILEKRLEMKNIDRIRSMDENE